MIEVKPCPFCGWAKSRIYSRCLRDRIRYIGGYRLHAIEKRFYVRCNRCYAHGGNVSGFIAKRLDLFRIPASIIPEDYVKRDYPELPTWVTTEEALEEKATALWNMRVES